MSSSFRVAGIGALAAAALCAQGMESGSRGRDAGFKVHGEISPVPLSTASLTVELSGNGAVPAESVRVAPDGSFEFHSAPPGMYELRLVGAGGAILYKENVVLSGASQILSIRVTEGSTARRSTESTVSLRQLEHKVPEQARKAFSKGAQAESKGQYQAAADYYRQAVSIDSEFADAFNELGALEAKQGDLSHAAADFQKAIDAVPEHGPALSNLSIVLAKMRRFDEAAQTARRAIKLMPGSGTLRFVLATSLLLAQGDSDEVLDNLERSSGEVPRAHLVAAELLVQRGKRSEAVQHLEEYLQAAPAGEKERDRAKALLAELRP
jgi:tetratricopeptide (TPR) repeat protein